MNNKVFFIGCCAYFLSMGNVYAEENSIGSAPFTIGSESSVKSDTTRYEELAAKEDAHSKYLKAKAKKSLIQEKMNEKDYIGALDPTGEKDKVKAPESFSPVQGMQETMVFDGTQSPNLGHAPVGFYDQKPEPVMSEKDKEKEQIKKDMPMISNISMVDGVVYIGVMQDGVQFVAEINEELNSGYKITKINSMFATIKKPSGKVVKVYVGTGDSEGGNSVGSTGGGTSNNSSGDPSSQTLNSNINMNIDGTPTLGAAGLPM